VQLCANIMHRCLMPIVTALQCLADEEKTCIMVDENEKRLKMQIAA